MAPRSNQHPEGTRHHAYFTYCLLHTLMAKTPSPGPSISFPSGVSNTGCTPKKGRLADPGLSLHQLPGTGVIMWVPVSVCHLIHERGGSFGGGGNDDCPWEPWEVQTRQNAAWERVPVSPIRLYIHTLLTSPRNAGASHSPGVNDGTPFLSDNVMEPVPGVLVDRLPNTPEHPEGGPVVPLDVLVAMLEQGSEEGGGRVELADLGGTVGGRDI